MTSRAAAFPKCLADPQRPQLASTGCILKLHHAVWKGLYSSPTLGHLQVTLPLIMEGTALWSTKRVTLYGALHHRNAAWSVPLPGRGRALHRELYSLP